MTNHPESLNPTDSASRITEETMASEIREENKVRDALAKLLKNTGCARDHCPDHSGYPEADRVLQSPDLRVTLIQPRYTLQTFGSTMTTVERDGKWVATFNSLFDAQSYINSKEPK